MDPTSPTHRLSCSSSRWLTAVAGLWLVVAATGMAWLASYKGRPGDLGCPPPRWPVTSPLNRAADRPTLLVFAHPHCSCTRATLEELARLLAQCPGRVRTCVVFLHPAGTPPAWPRSDRWDQAGQIPGVVCIDDAGACETRRFGATTSGQALLYAADGSLRYHGGLTPARGHAGDNRGRSALLRLVLTGADDTALCTGPVYGCPLFAPEGDPDEEEQPS